MPPVEKLSQYEAVRLFIERARAVKAGFEVTNDNAPAVAKICIRLDGLPLAIELAAARAKILAPEAMLSRLGSRLKLLKGGARDLPARQQTLHGAIEWSHDLLDEEDRVLFRRLSIFVGGFALETAEAVCDSGSEAELDVLDGVESLLGKSLLRQEETEDGRFYMLETIREYALERLEESGETGELRDLHAEHYLHLAEEAEPELKGPRQTEWLQRLDTEHDNLRAALTQTLQSGATEQALRLAGALLGFWHSRGHFSEGREWLEEALAKDTRPHAPAQGKALAAVAWLALYQWDLERMVAASDEGLELSAETGIEGSTAIFLRVTRGVAAREQGDTGEATRLLEEALALSREAEDGWGLALALLNLGGVATNSGDYERAIEQLEEGLAMSRELGDAALLSAALISLGYQYLLRGDHERATALNMEAAALCREQGHNSQMGIALDNLGWAALLRGDGEDATDLLKESLALSEELGDRLTTSESLDGLACAAGTRGEAGQAVRLFGAAVALREAVGVPLPPAARALREPYLRNTRSLLGKAEWTRAWEEGRAMSQEEAVAFALKDGPD